MSDHLAERLRADARPRLRLLSADQRARLDAALAAAPRRPSPARPPLVAAAAVLVAAALALWVGRLPEPPSGEAAPAGGPPALELAARMPFSLDALADAAVERPLADELAALVRDARSLGAGLARRVPAPLRDPLVALAR